MKQSLLKLALLVGLPAAVIFVTSCGDTCETKQADVKEIPPSCTFARPFFR